MRKIRTERFDPPTGLTVYTVASKVLEWEGEGDKAFAIVPDDAEILEIYYCPRRHVEKLLFNGKEFNPYPTGKAVLIRRGYWDYPVLLLESGEKIETPISAHSYIAEKRAGVGFGEWFALLKGEISFEALKEKSEENWR